MESLKYHVESYEGAGNPFRHVRHIANELERDWYVQALGQYNPDLLLWGLSDSELAADGLTDELRARRDAALGWFFKKKFDYDLDLDLRAVEDFLDLHGLVSATSSCPLALEKKLLMSKCKAFRDDWSAFQQDRLSQHENWSCLEELRPALDAQALEELRPDLHDKLELLVRRVGECATASVRSTSRSRKGSG